MRVKMILFRDPAIDKKGDQLVAFYRKRYLEDNGHEVDTLIVGNQIKFNMNWFLLAMHNFILRGQPLQVAITNNFKLEQEMNHASSEYDLIYVNTIRCRNFIPNEIKSKVCIELIDSLSLNYTRRIKHASNLIKRWMLKIEAKRLKKLERKIACLNTDVSVVSVQDANWIGIDKVRINKLGVVIPSTCEQFNKSADSFTLGFLGNLDYAPNQLAVKKLCEFGKYFEAQDLNIKIKIAGKMSPNYIRKLDITDSVSFLGFVEDKNLFLNNLDLFVAPLTIGSGMQNKILEAMAVKTPVLTTALGAGDINAIPEKSILVHELDQFCKVIPDLMASKRKLREIGLAGFQVVRESHNWETLNKSYFKRLLMV